MILRVLRGGAYFSGTWNLRSTYRLRFQPEFRNYYFGFRLIVRRAP